MAGGGVVALRGQKDADPYAGDGAHSKVRRSIPDACPVGMSQASVWGVLDGELETDFPDIWSKTLVYSQEYGSILIIPRERNMTAILYRAEDGKPEERPQSAGPGVCHAARQGSWLLRGQLEVHRMVRPVPDWTARCEPLLRRPPAGLPGRRCRPRTRPKPRRDEHLDA